MVGLVEKSGGRNGCPGTKSRPPAKSSVLLWAADGVSDRGSYTDNIVGTEVVRVVEDSVVTHFGTDEGVPPHVVADTSS